MTSFVGNSLLWTMKSHKDESYIKVLSSVWSQQTLVYMLSNEDMFLVQLAEFATAVLPRVVGSQDGSIRVEQSDSQIHETIRAHFRTLVD
jgi:hypothetical protein